MCALLPAPSVPPGTRTRTQPHRPPHPSPGLFKELESRAQRSEYRRLLAECQAVYSQARLQLVGPFVQQRVTSLAAQPVPVLMRSGYEYLLRVGCWGLEGAAAGAKECCCAAGGH